MTNPSVSVIIPTYSRPYWLRIALTSAIVQLNEKVEIIVVDDGSPDHDKNQNLANEFNIRYIFQSNKGSGAARNTGLRIAKGEFIQYLDDDDFLAKDAIQKKLVLLQQDSTIGAVYSDTFLTHESGQPIRKYLGDFPRPLPKGDLFELLLERNFITTHSLLWRKSILEKIGGFPLRSTCEDWEVLIRAASITKFNFIDEPLCYYRLHEGGIHRNFELMYIGRLFFQQEIINTQKFKKLPIEKQVHFLCKFAIQQIAYGDGRIANEFLSTASKIADQKLSPRFLLFALNSFPLLSRVLLRAVIRLNSRLHRI